MPRTEIKIRTWRCPSCEHAYDFDPFDRQYKSLLSGHGGTPLGYCWACWVGANPTGIKDKVLMVKVTDQEKKTTMTVMGEEDIEEEILEKTESVHRTRRLAEKEMNLKSKIQDGIFMLTPTGESKLRAKDQADVEESIVRLRKERFFLTTPAEIVVYRAKRKQDIQVAITEARKSEDL